ncbi:hypothetical protein SAMN05444166_4775 [Singulisphaera sp. GP187]|uniref:hypothetical protein n=1 Tax=Singulisphaera sp. GP187 TaxID=1882752 RepID=UPI000927CB00|nr:hypothetical protein [Singulisphaera sp. GP187]SIO44419.1 hypothetical protein SAMN05444166_4775 [Singulisphaera sp. GP187]
MGSHRTGSSRRNRQRYVAWAALALGWLLPSVGCQVEYAGMTLPSGKYMHDDVQYFAPGPDFPMANSQAAAQRARMQAMGLEPESIGAVAVPPAPGAIPAVQNQFGRPTDVNASPLSIEPPVGTPVTPPAPDAITPPGAVPPPGAP